MTAFEIRSDEGLPIRGNFDAPAQPQSLVVAVHGFKGFKDWGFFPWLADHLCRYGAAVCRFNMSRSGIGENSDTFDRLDLFAGDTYSTQLADLRTATDHAQARFPGLPTFLLGHSRGGGIAILGAHSVPRLHGVIAWSPIARADRWDDATKKRWRADGFMDVENQRTKQMMRMSTAILDDYEKHHRRLDILGAASKLKKPLLVIHGGRDESVPPAEGREVFSRAREGAIATIAAASHTYNAIHPLVNVPRELVHAAEISAHFVSAYD
jgi:alpha-beta hydrolase superfamily lysophospholipase